MSPRRNVTSADNPVASAAPAVPSTFDRERAWPHYSYLIATVERGRVTEIACWRLGDGSAAAFEAEEWGVGAGDA